MSYYRGDYYAGGIGSFFGHIFSGVRGLAKGLLTGGTPTGGAKSAAVASAAGAGMAMVKAGASAIRSGIVKHPVLSAAGAAGGGLAIGAIGRGGAARPAMAVDQAGFPMRGFHISKKTGMVVRNRRMNPCNGRALNRATRRLHAFAKRYKKVVGFVSPHPKRGRMYIKKAHAKK